jgi:hypothetical protein
MHTSTHYIFTNSFQKKIFMKIAHKNSISILTVMVTMALSACGGGGSSSTTAGAEGGNPKIATVSTLTGVNGFKVNYTPNFDIATGWKGAITSPLTYTSTSSINSFAVSDGATPANTYSQSTASGIAAGTLSDLHATTILSGTTCTYSRFGWLSGSVTETDGSTSDWYTPFALASTTPTSLSNLVYAGTQQASVYLEGNRSSTLSGVSGYATCDTNANYTASNKTLKLTLSNCNTVVGFNISGNFSLSTGTGITTITAQEIQRGAANQTVTSTSVESGNFLLAGSNGEELVGAATIKGSIALSNGTGGINPAIFLVVFGGKMQ